MDPDLVPWHLGALHPFEQVLTVVIAVGPFLAIPFVIRHRRRQDAARSAEDSAAPRSRR